MVAAVSPLTKLVSVLARCSIEITSEAAEQYIETQIQSPWRRDQGRGQSWHVEPERLEQVRQLLVTHGFRLGRDFQEWLG